ncbi:MAG: SBBP repeat-containing protein [Blastocatellia bacterium]
MFNTRRWNRRVSLLVLTLFGLTGFVAWHGKASDRATADHPPARAASLNAAQNRARLDEAYGKLPLSFEANRGQIDSRVQFISRSSAATLFLTADEAVLALSPPHATTAAVRMKMLKANPAARPEGLEPLAATANYFTGRDPNHWHTDVPTFARVQYGDVYPGISLVYYGNQRQLEYDFVVAAGSDPRPIKLGFTGARRLRISAEGDLVLRVAGGEMRFHKPVAYQETDGGKRMVEARYQLKGRREVGFALGAYDHSKRLVIDPVLSYSTYLGGSSVDDGRSIAVDSSGNVYVTGRTSSFNFPVTIDGYDSTYANASDVYVTKLNTDGTALVYSTYLGGASEDLGYGLVVDSSGNAYVTGSTSSTDFPTTPGAFQTVLQGGSYPGDAFVTKLNPTGTALIYSTYLGGSSSDQANSIALDSSGNAYVVGYTYSGNFPTTPGAFQTTYASGSYPYGDAFVTKLNNAGTALAYSTYLGGTSADTANGVKVDASGNAYVAGTTLSTGFPTTPGAFQTTYGGASGNYSNLGDGFVTKLNNIGTALAYSTYLGGRGDDGGFGIDVSATGEAYVIGQTSSVNFPTTPGVVRVADGGIAKTTNSGASWAAINTGINSFTILALAIHPSAPTTVYAGTLGGNGNNGGAFKSTNGGATWNAINSGLTDLTIRSLAIDPNTATTIYLGTNSRGVFRSTDGGTSWRAINTGENGMTVNSLVIDPTNSSIIYAGTDQGVFKTTNGGANWAAKINGLSQGTYINALAIDPLAPATIYAGLSYGGVYKSTNGGTNWSPTGLINVGIKPLMIDSSASSVIYAGTANGLFRSTDGGQSWNGSNNGLTNRSVNALAQSSTDSMILYAGTGNGVFKSTDGGNLWAAAGAGLAGLVINTLAIDPVTPTAIYSGSESGAMDAFITKLNATGTALGYSTYLGGSNFDQGTALAADSAGNVYVTGYTQSLNFPTTPGGYQSYGSSYSTDAFVSKLSPTASGLSYSSYLGGYDGDVAYGIAIDAGGNAYVTGNTQSQNFPVTPGAFQATLGSNYNSDAFISKFVAVPSITSDLAITMTATASPISAGNGLMYSITLTNNGPERASSVVVNDDLPSAVVYNSCDSSSYNCSHAGNNVTFTFATLESGASATMSIYTYVNCSVADNTTFSNTVSVTSSGSDPMPDNNSAMTTSTATNPPPSLTPTSQTFPVGGGSGSLNVNRGTGCNWTASSNAPWITITYSSNYGNGFVNYNVAGNSSAARQGTMTIAGQTFTVNQAGACSAAPATSSAMFNKYAGANSVMVNAASGCNWNAVSNTPWITITSGASGTGNGSVNYSVMANTTGSQRVGTLTIAGQTFTVTQAGPSIKLNFDDDLKSEIGYYRNGLWGFLKSSESFNVGFFYSWGGAGRAPIIADFDGDGKVDLGYIEPPAGGQSAAYAILLSSHSYSFATGQPLFVPAGFPSIGDMPVVGDFDGDGKADPAIWRASQGVWMIPTSSSNYATYIFSQWGQAGDTPVVGDIDGDGRADFGYYRNGVWAFLQSSQGYSYGSPRFFNWGGAERAPIIADFDGDGLSDLAYIEPPAGNQSASYAILLSSHSYSFAAGQPLFVPAGFPSIGDTPVVTDYDGDGKADPGIWRASQGVWIIPQSSANYSNYIFKQWGQAGDVALPNALNQQ